VLNPFQNSILPILPPNLNHTSKYNKINHIYTIYIETPLPPGISPSSKGGQVKKGDQLFIFINIVHSPFVKGESPNEEREGDLLQ